MKLENKECSLVLENGIVLNGKSSITKNIVGNVSIDNGQIEVECLNTNTLFKFEMENSNLKNNNLLGKIIIDDLPIDYHMYDLKTIL